MSKHTATRWAVDPEDDRKVICEADGSFIADCNGLTDDPIDGANAAHIVRCVNSHDALVGALEKAYKLFEDDGWSIYGGIRTTILSALSAARGES